MKFRLIASLVILVLLALGALYMSSPSAQPTQSAPPESGGIYLR